MNASALTKETREDAEWRSRKGRLLSTGKAP